MSPQSPTIRRNGYALLSVLLLLAALVVACGGGNQSANPSQTKNVKQVPLTINANQTDAWTENFNPYSASAVSGAVQGTLYETLLYFNRLTGDIKPWLAKSYDFSDGGKTLTFHLQTGVKWSDGQAFSSDDVLFTLEEYKQYPAMDGFGIWQYIQDTSAPDASTFVVKLKSSYSPILWYLGGQSWIVPRHDWSNIKGDPTQFANPKPVGTGPYTVSKFDPHLVVEVKNPNYWQTVPVNELRFATYSNNDSSELALIKGDILWDSLYIPNIEQTYIKRDPVHNHYWFPSSDVVMLMLNLTKAPFNDLQVRKAISLALDRERIYKVAESGYEPVASPTGLLLPYNKDLLAPEFADTNFTQDAAQAEQILQAAGYTKGSDGIYSDKSGKKMSFNLNVVSGYTDWVSTCQVVAANLGAIGIKININQISYDNYYNAMQTGQYDISISGTNSGPSPFYLYDGLLRSTNSAPVGQQASTNFIRWIDKPTDQLLDQYVTSTDKAVQTQALQGLQKIMVEQLPAIPLVNEPFWFQASTTHYTGWPDANNTYAVPSPYIYPDNEIVLLSIKPV